MSTVQIICNGFIQWNVKTVSSLIRPMELIFGSESALSVRAGDPEFVACYCDGCGPLSVEEHGKD
jgi:hypothetical protein